jgi:23S rRNA (cytidine2498-2'-O)-methyltransferase
MCPNKKGEEGGTEAIALLCKPGFEDDATAEIVHHFGQVRSARIGAGFVTLKCDSLADAIRVHSADLSMLPNGFRFVFVTDIFQGKLVAFPPSTRDRLAPLLDVIIPSAEANASSEPLAIRVVAPESTAVAGLPKFCSGFENVLSAGIRKRGHRVAGTKSAGETDPNSLEVFVIFFDYGLALAGVRPVHFGSRAHRRGRVPREKDAPSRSGSKLLEAWRFFELPQAAMRGPAGKPPLAVDLGAAPGGWSSVLAAAGYSVHAVDNGDLDKALIAKYGQKITHLKKDAFHFAPEPGVSIVTCDIVERPAQVTDLLLRWLRLTKLKVLVFNLKLPMKKRYEEINRCLERLQKGMQEAGTEFEIDAHQLYHDRQEVTVVVRTLGS